MAWSSPPTVTAGSVLTASDWNMYVRDNINEFAAAKLPFSLGGTDFAVRMLRTLPNNSLEVVALRHADDTAVISVSSGSYVAMGPSVQTTVPGGRVLVLWTCELVLTSAPETILASVGVAGDTTVPPSDDWAISLQSTGTNGRLRTSRAHVFDNLNPGTTTFGMYYRVSAGTHNFKDRQIVVLSL